MGLREAIEAASDRPREAVDVSDYWPDAGTVYVSVMSGTDRDSWECSLQEALDKKRDLMALMLVRCLTDEQGQRLFRDDEAALLGGKNWIILDRLCEVARRLNRTSRAATDAIEKNFAGALGAASS